ncbi:ATP/GTP-binding protein family isoform X2 [Wolffia australiana]
MYPIKSSNAYGQQSYSAQQPYSHPAGGGYPGSQISAPDGSSQHAAVSRQSSMLNSSQETDVGAYRVHSQASQYSGPYASVYGSSALSGAQQMPVKATGSTSLQGRATYSSSYPDSSKFGSGVPSGGIGMNAEDYGASGYGHNVDHQYSMERRHYGDRQSAFMGRDDPSFNTLQSQKSETREQYEQASLYRQQQMMKVPSLQPASDTRQADYLAARAAAVHHGHADINSSYGGRMDVDPRSMPVAGTAPYGGQRSGTSLGGPSRGNVEHVYPPGPTSAGYRVGLPPGREYDVGGKGLHGAALEPSYQGRILPQGGFSSVSVPFRDERKDDQGPYQRELDLREERRRELALREREKERERELERDRERERERDRERQRERERARERERERQRQRDLERERERLQKQREKEREQDRKRGSESTRQERSPSRTSKDRQASSAPRADRTSRASPRRDTLHRRHSPVKDKRREYICKVSALCVSDPVRDYMSLSKRYPRLSISPEFSKVVFSWPKEKLNVSLYTHVSFQHEFTVASERTDVKQKLGSQNSQGNVTVWNAKVILMSGISSEALEELCSDHNSDNRVSHFNNLLRFAILRKDHSFTAIGGPWNAALDGGDPSTDETSLVRTAKRYMKDLAQIDLESCQHWNRFIEIHYERVDKDGLPSHKEVTVLYLPDLSHCLPSRDQWKSQWLAQKTLGVEKNKKSDARDRSLGDTSEAAIDSQKDTVIKMEEDTPIIHPSADSAVETPVNNQTEVETSPVNKEMNKELETAAVDQKSLPQETGDDNDGEKLELLEEEVTKSSPKPTNVRTFVRKRVTRKVPAAKTQAEKAAELSEHDGDESNKADIKDGQEGAITPIKEMTATKTTVKKRIIRKVIKKKKVSKASIKDDGKLEPDVPPMVAEADTTTQADVETAAADLACDGDGEGEGDGYEKMNHATDEKKIPEEDDQEEEKKTASSELGVGESQTQEVKKQGESSQQEENGKEKKIAVSKQESSVKDSNGRRPEAAPEHPGFFLKTKQSKDSKIRSMSLSLDGLLDYNEKDTAESTFELSLFAESLNEMLQFEMGRRLLFFLQNLRKNAVSRRKQQKRDRDEKGSEKKEAKVSSEHKRLKSVDESANNSNNAPPPTEINSNEEEKAAGEAEKPVSAIVEEEAMEEDDFREPEEASENNQQAEDASPEEKDASQEERPKEEVAQTLPKVEEQPEERTKEPTDEKENVAKEARRFPKEDTINKDLLQAFRYFDRNRVGYLKAEDLRLIIHNLGLFLSQKEVKELVQSAILETSSSSSVQARDNRIMYQKLVRITDF